MIWGYHYIQKHPYMFINWVVLFATSLVNFCSRFLVAIYNMHQDHIDHPSRTWHVHNISQWGLFQDSAVGFWLDWDPKNLFTPIKCWKTPSETMCRRMWDPPPKKSHCWYCWWKISCTGWWVVYPITRFCTSFRQCFHASWTEFTVSVVSSPLPWRLLLLFVFPEKITTRWFAQRLCRSKMRFAKIRWPNVSRCWIRDGSSWSGAGELVVQRWMKFWNMVMLSPSCLEKIIYGIPTI